jgi:hypothetical protein
MPFIRRGEWAGAPVGESRDQDARSNMPSVSVRVWPGLIAMKRENSVS